MTREGLNFAKNSMLKLYDLRVAKPIESFSSKSVLDGLLYPQDKLPKLVKYLEKIGVHVYCTNGL